jgi:UDP-GlcNAc:undecaprenyl-phosphate GlcNAc-1-phosphate transferase
MYSLVALFVFSVVFSLLLTPMVRSVCRRYGLVDHPDARKVHRNPIPRAGGIAIAFSFLLAYGLLLALGAKAGDLVWSARADIGRLAPAAAMVFLLGLADDLVSLTAAPKLAVEAAAALLAYQAGVHLNAIGVHHLPAWLSLPVTVFWLLACTNAVNLLDGLDGLAAGLGIFATASTLGAALIQHNIGLALAVVPLLGALIGFIFYNFNPATIFLGDSGSLFIGFLLGCFGVLWSQKSATLLGMTAPLMVLVLPLLDTSISIARRLLRRKPIFSPDRGHIHHRLLDRGLNQRDAVLVLYACCALAALCSLAVMNAKVAETVIIVFCAFVWFGIHRLGYRKLEAFGRLFDPRNFQGMLQAQMRLDVLEDSLAGAQTVDECWTAVRQASREFGFTHLAMRLDHTFYEERFGEEKAQLQTWTVRVPLSGTEFINIGHSFQDSLPSPVIGPFADALRRAIEPKLPAFRQGIDPNAPVRIVKFGHLS